MRDTLIDPALKAGGVRVGICDPDDMKARLPEWEDLPRLSGDTTRVIAPARQTNEYMAIAGYIDKGILKKG